jgi:hypothetical protein
MKTYTKPKKYITKETQSQFPLSSSFNKLMHFISDLQTSVQSQPISSTQLSSPHLQPIISYLQTLEDLVDKVPPLQQKMRFGNKAFVQWLELAGVEAEKMLTEVLKGKEEWKGAEVELREYLAESYGNNTR